MGLDSIDEAAAVRQRLNLLWRSTCIRRMTLGLVERDEEMRLEIFRRDSRSRTGPARLEGESTLRVISESLLYAPLLVCGKVEFGAHALPSAKHGDVGSADSPLVGQVAAHRKHGAGVWRLKKSQPDALRGGRMERHEGIDKAIQWPESVLRISGVCPLAEVR
jgi:hypothetical protein